MKAAYMCWLDGKIEADAVLVEAVDAQFAAVEFVEKANDEAAGDLLLPDDDQHVIVHVRGAGDVLTSWRVTASVSIDYWAAPHDDSQPRKTEARR